MRFRPCIDIHDGKVKQIVGGTLRDDSAGTEENYVSAWDADRFARMYAADHLTGGHVILLNPAGSPMYPKTWEQAEKALRAVPGLLQAGGGVSPENAWSFLDAGASRVIVTSYVFRDGRIHRERLEEMVRAVGSGRLVLDLSCRAVPDPEKGTVKYRIVTDRWQKISGETLTPELMRELGGSCSEFLVHAVDSEGRSKGPQEEVLRILGEFCDSSDIPVTYAGGIHSMEDLRTVKSLGRGKIDFTVGSALDLFGGSLPYEMVKKAQ